MNVLDIFSGIGGFSLGLERAGMRTVAFCETNPYARAVLARHWPDVPCYGDVRQLAITRLRADGISADVICGGFPCQDISLAGAGAGLKGERSGLWSEFARGIGELRPRYVIVENVAALLGRGLGDVLGDLATLGYDAEWHCIRASDIGAIHDRDRVWIIAYPVSPRRARLVTGADFGEAGPWRLRGQKDLQSIAAAPFEQTDRWPQPLLRRMDDGISGRVERLGRLGNAVVPQIAEIIGRAIMTGQP
jgi:DNA (cytosine-5)-methyltransferase 1